jgi:hypothetical protein
VDLRGRKCQKDQEIYNAQHCTTHSPLITKYRGMKVKGHVAGIRGQRNAWENNIKLDKENIQW